MQSWRWSLIEPAPAWLIAQPFAHRGLHRDAIIENSRAAFVAAIAAGHGIECDVRVSSDGIAFVFHDAELDRLTGESGTFETKPAAMLDAISLKQTDETIPRLDAVLAQIGRRVPILIELKSPDRNVAPLCAAVAQSLCAYRGDAAVMSFNPQVGAWFARNAADVVRGLVVTEHNRRGWKGAVSRRIALWRSRPDFLAYDVRDLPSCFASRHRSQRLPVLTWTVRDSSTLAAATAHADQIIHELPVAELDRQSI